MNNKENYAYLLTVTALDFFSSTLEQEHVAVYETFIGALEASVELEYEQLETIKDFIYPEYTEEEFYNWKQQSIIEDHVSEDNSEYRKIYSDINDPNNNAILEIRVVKMVVNSEV